MSRRADLRALAAALRGEPPPDADWFGVLLLANQALVTPYIHAAAIRAGTLDRLPEEVRAFTAEVFARNRERNRRLFGQLHEAVAALNAAGIEPVLLKGAALWAGLGRPEAFDRMLNDIDLLVAPADAPRAVQALTDAGFGLLKSFPGPNVHVVAELARPTDVGLIDLHQRLPGPPQDYLAELAGDARHCPIVEWRGVRARVPAPAAQLFFLVLHDQFHDGDYWRGRFALRHLLDIALLTNGPEPLDWALLRRLARTRLVANAMDAELIAAHRIAGAEVPEAIRRRPWARLQYARHLAQVCWPGLAWPLIAMGVASEGLNLLAHRAANRADQARLLGAQPARGGSLTDRMYRLGFILGDAPAGKI